VFCRQSGKNRRQDRRHYLNRSTDLRPFDRYLDGTVESGTEGDVWP
jgi:hypothetical protein